MNSDCAETDDGSLALAFLSLRFLSASQILFSSNWEAPFSQVRSGDRVQTNDKGIKERGHQRIMMS